MILDGSEDDELEENSRLDHPNQVSYKTFSELDTTPIDKLYLLQDSYFAE